MLVVRVEDGDEASAIFGLGEAGIDDELNKAVLTLKTVLFFGFWNRGERRPEVRSTMTTNLHGLATNSGFRRRRTTNKRRTTIYTARRRRRQR